MSRFAPLIRATSQRLDLPQPARARVLVEMAADLEDLFEHYTAAGASEDEAHRRACERFELSDEALRRLVAVHASPVRRLLERVSERTRAWWERVMIVILAAYFAATTLEVMMSHRFFLDASPLIWPVVALGLLALAIGIARVYALYLKGDHDPRRVRRGLTTLIGIAVMCPILGCYTMVVELMMLAFKVYPNPERAFVGVVLVMLRIAPVMITSLLVAVAAAVLWYLLSRTAIRLEQATARALIEAGAAQGALP
jgi:hypothetical protein